MEIRRLGIETILRDTDSLGKSNQARELSRRDDRFRLPVAAPCAAALATTRRLGSSASRVCRWASKWPRRSVTTCWREQSSAAECDSWVGWDHWGWSLIDGCDDFGVIDPA
jgi:hypothetical protein